MHPTTIHVFIAVVVALGMTKAAPIPIRPERERPDDGEEPSPFIQGLPGWKPWYGIGPVVRPIVKHYHTLKWPSATPIKRPDKHRKIIPQPPSDPIDSETTGIDKRNEGIGIKGWHPLFGKGPILYHWKQEGPSEPLDRTASSNLPGDASEDVLPFGLGP